MKSKVIFMALLVCAFAVQAKPVSEHQVRMTARAWSRGGSRLGIRLGARIESLKAYSLTNGVSFYAAKMEKGGTVFLAGDTDDEPVIAMAESDMTELDVASPLYALLKRDLTFRMKVREAAGQSSTPLSHAALRRWQQLARAGERLEAGAIGAVDPIEELEIDEIRVDPLVLSKWNQSGHGENYYTPKNYVCGCVATALAQVMRYYCFPTTFIPAFRNDECEVDNVSCPTTALGGVYDWANMPLIPSSTTDIQKKAIGRLTFDCGVAVGMGWSNDGSYAYSHNVPTALRNIFGYASAAYTDDEELGSSEELREQIVYASLDAGLPVIFGIADSNDFQSGHEIIGDGYGYVDGVSYVHLNMGWGGDGDVWYHLPDISYTAKQHGFKYDANTINSCTYDIEPMRTGVVLSGRTLGEDDEIISNAVVTISRVSDGAAVCTLTSSVHGVYGALLPANAEYRIEAVLGLYAGERAGVLQEKNVWGADVVLYNPSIRVYEAGLSEVTTNSTLDRALATAAALTNPILEIFAPTTLTKPAVITNSCFICAAPELAGPAFVYRDEEFGYPALTVAAGTVGFSNVVFEAAATTPVFVEEGANTFFLGLVSGAETLSLEAADQQGFLLAGELSGGIRVTVPEAMTNGAVFGWAACSLPEAQEAATQILHPTDPLLGGEAFVDSQSGSIFLRWAEAEVSPDAAVASGTGADGIVHHFRSFESALESGVTNIVLKKSSTLDRAITVTDKLALSSENGAILTPGASAKFVAAGGELSFEDIIVEGFKGADSLLVVDGGTVTLGAGTIFRNLETCRASGTCTGPILVRTGTLIMESGTLLTGLRAVSPANAQESGVYGGAVCVYPNAVFEMRGGQITGCFAEVYGGGVYAFNKAVVRLSGDASVRGNTCWGKDGATIEDDIRLSPKAELVLDDVLTGSVGIAYTSAKNADGVPFVTASSEDILTASADSFVNTAVSTECRARLQGGALVWEKVIEDEGPFPVEPKRDEDDHITNAVARVIYPNDTTNYWASFEDAILSLKGPATIEMIQDDTFQADLSPTYDITVRTASDYHNSDGYVTAWISRADECSFIVTNGVSVTLEGLDITGGFSSNGSNYFGGKERLFDVRGGTLCLDDIQLYNVFGEADRASAAVVVYQGGRFEMKGNSVITLCENSYDDAGMNAGVAAGLIIEDEGSCAVLSNAMVTLCYARRAGGVFVGNGAEIRLAGNTRISDNSCLDLDSKGNLALAKGAKLVLDGVLENRVGLSEGIGGDPLVFGTVVKGASGEALASAENFCHDRTHVFAEAVDGQLRWKDLSTRTVVTAPTKVAGPFTYKLGFDQIALKAQTGFSVYNGSAMDAGSYTAFAELDDGYVWDDGSAGVKSYPWTIKPAPLLVTIEDATKTEGDDDPEFMCRLEGLQSLPWCRDKFTWNAEREPGEEPGEYEITVGTYEIKCYVGSIEPVDSKSNYQITVVPGTLTIEAAEEDDEEEAAPSGGLSGAALPSDGTDVSFSIVSFGPTADGAFEVIISPARAGYSYTAWRNADLSDAEGWEKASEPVVPTADGSATLRIGSSGGAFLKVIATPILR